MSRNDFTECLFGLIKINEVLTNADIRLDFRSWCKFIENNQNCYKNQPALYLPVDELFPTKARCRFTQYMPNKLDKFGIKFWLASDVNSKL